MLVILDYGIGNLTSIQKMLDKAGVMSSISGSENDILQSTQLLLPGMGHFDSCMNKLNASGLRSAIEHRVFKDKVPILGICVGLQMLLNRSEEGNEPGLGWVEGEVVRFNPISMNSQLKIPHMGWEEIRFSKDSALARDLNDSRFYFAHSYHAKLSDPSNELIIANYGYDFTAGLIKDNIVGVQFHPEKSHRFGMQFLKNFAEYNNAAS